MTPIQNIGLALFVLLSIGVAIGHKTECGDGAWWKPIWPRGWLQRCWGMIFASNPEPTEH